MSIFKDILKEGESLFTNELALDYSFVPKMIPYRENQQKYIAGCIKPLLSNRNGKNMIVTGSPGIGKTVACLHIIKELEETTDDVTPIYINCWQKNTTYKVILAICDILGYKFTQNKKTEELFDIAKGIINKQSAVFVFDEIDKAEDFGFLYSVLEEIYRKSIILITNQAEWIDEIDERILSRLVPEVLEFKPYNFDETKGILKEREAHAFVPNVLNADAFELIVKKTYDLKDLRIGLYLMRESGMIAEDALSKKITKDHASSAIGKLIEFSTKKSEELDEVSNKILGLIKENSGKKIGEIFKLYQADGGNLTYKSFQRKVNKLDENKFISTEKIVGGAEGTTTILNSAIDKKITEF